MCSSKNEPSSGYSRSILCAIKDIKFQAPEPKRKRNRSVSGVLALPQENQSITSKLPQKNEDEFFQQGMAFETSSTDPTRHSFLKLKKSKRKSVSAERALNKSQKCTSVSNLDVLKAHSLGSLNSNEGKKFFESELRVKNLYQSNTTSKTSRDQSIASKDNSSEGDKISIGRRTKVSFSTYAMALNACSESDFEKVKNLIDTNPDLVNYSYPFCNRLTCLHVAAKAGSLPIIQYLVRCGANLNPKDDKWNTPLHLAAQSNNGRALALLKSLGADTTQIDAYGHLYSAYLSTKNAHNNASNSNPHSDDDDSSTNSSITNSLHRMGSLRLPFKRAVRDFLKR